MKQKKWRGGVLRSVCEGDGGEGWGKTLGKGGLGGGGSVAGWDEG